MDVCDGVFPNNVIRSSNSSTPQERKQFEEERRLFYVGMTRAKNDLNIFKLSDNVSCFIKEIHNPVDKDRKVKKTSVKSQTKPKLIPYSSAKEEYVYDFELVIGERVVQKTFGAGTVTDAVYDDNGNVKNFSVFFDNSGAEKTFAFPAAFIAGMQLESGAEVPIRKVSKAVVNTPVTKVKTIPKRSKTSRAGNKNTYAYWANEYADYVVIKKEGAFWTCRGDSAETVKEILGYKLGGNPDKPVTGSPNLDSMVDGLNRHQISYIVVEDGEIIDQSDY